MLTEWIAVPNTWLLLPTSNKSQKKQNEILLPYLASNVQKRLGDLEGDDFSTLQLLCQRRNVGRLSLLYRYYYGRCSDKLHSLLHSASLTQILLFGINSRESFLKTTVNILKASHTYLCLRVVLRIMNAAKIRPATVSSPR